MHDCILQRRLSTPNVATWEFASCTRVSEQRRCSRWCSLTGQSRNVIVWRRCVAVWNCHRFAGVRWRGGDGLVRRSRASSRQLRLCVLQRHLGYRLANLGNHSVLRHGSKLLLIGCMCCCFPQWQGCNGDRYKRSHPSSTSSSCLVGNDLIGPLSNLLCLFVSSALCNVIPEKFQNDEVKTGIIRIKAKVNRLV